MIPGHNPFPVAAPKLIAYALRNKRVKAPSANGPEADLEIQPAYLVLEECQVLIQLHSTQLGHMHGSCWVFLCDRVLVIDRKAMQRPAVRAGHSFPLHPKWGWHLDSSRRPRHRADGQRDEARR